MPQPAHGADVGARLAARGRQPGDGLLCPPFLPVRDLELTRHPLPVPAALPRVGTRPAGRGRLGAELLTAPVQRQLTGVVVAENRSAAGTFHDAASMALGQYSSASAAAA